jgi:ssRNA-specific RNase YbeY (16S rRNA maturation enzyme)
MLRHIVLPSSEISAINLTFTKIQYTTAVILITLSISQLHSMYQAIDIHTHVISFVLVETDFSQISRFYFLNVIEKLVTVQYYCNLS